MEASIARVSYHLRIAVRGLGKQKAPPDCSAALPKASEKKGHYRPVPIYTASIYTASINTVPSDTAQIDPAR